MTKRDGVNWSQLRDIFRAASPDGFVGFAERHNIERRYARSMWKGLPAPMMAYLQLCRALNRDPLDLAVAPAMPMGPGGLLLSIFGAAIAGTRHLRGVGMHKAGDEAGVSGPTVLRAEAGILVSANSFIRLVRWLGSYRHPHEFVSRIADDVSRPTATETIGEQQ